MTDPIRSPTVLGIDPGLDGALAWLGPDRATATITPTITGVKRSFDLGGMRQLLSSRTIDLCVIERVGAAPVKGQRQGTTSMFSFGFGFGAWVGLLVGLQIPFQLVAPQAWKKDVLAGTAKDKKAAIEFCQARYPAVSLLATARSRVPHHGIADALCLATHALHLLGTTGGSP